MNGLLALSRHDESPVREAVKIGLVTLLCLCAAATALQYAMNLPMRFVPTVIGSFGLTA